MKTIRAIYWELEAKKIKHPNIESFNEFVSTLDPQKRLSMSNHGVKTTRSYYEAGTWRPMFQGYVEDGICYTCEIYYCKSETEYEIHTLVGKENQSISGFDAFKVLKQKMKQNNNKGMTARFGSFKQTISNIQNYIEPIHRINQNVGPIIGCLYEVQNTPIEGVNKADVSSAYPGEGSKTLPTTKGMIIKDGRVKPTEEYPFAYYLSSGHIAIYDELDTHYDCDHFLYREWTRKPGQTKRYKNKKVSKIDKKIGFLEVEDKDEKTLLMKASPETLRPEFEYFYDIKSNKALPEEERDIAKAVMNFTIGCWDWINCPEGTIIPSKVDYYGHLRAVILARHNHNMIKYYDEIVAAGGEVYQIQTDSIIWKGPIIDSVKTEKKLGDLILEIENAFGFIHGCGAYWLEADGKILKKHQGVKDCPELNSIEDYVDFFMNKKSIIMTSYIKFDMENMEYYEQEVLL